MLVIAVLLLSRIDTRITQTGIGSSSPASSGGGGSGLMSFNPNFSLSQIDPQVDEFKERRGTQDDFDLNNFGDFFMVLGDVNSIS